MLLLIALLFSFLTTAPHEVAAEGFLTGSQNLEITDYSVVKQGINTGNFIQSDIFTVGGYQWAIEFYPQGWNQLYSDSISVMLRLINPSNGARAMFTFRLLDWQTSIWSTDTPWSSEVDTFSASGNISWGQFAFIKRSKLQGSNYLRNDVLLIKTTLWVANGSHAVLQLPLSTNGSTGNNNNPGNVTTVDVSFDDNN